MTYNVCRKINIACAVLTFILFVDLIILPKIEKKEKIVARKAEYYYTSQKYRGSTRVKSDQRLMITENYKYPIESYQQFEYWKCDSIRLFVTPILREVKTGFVKLEGKEYELPSRGSVFRDLIFFPILFGLCSVIGVLVKNNEEQTLNFGVMNVILFIILLYVMRII